MIKVFCDLCKKELTRNMVAQRLAVKSGNFTAEVIISKKGIANEGDLCLDCLLKMLKQKPKRKYEKKQKTEQVSNPPVEPVIEKIKKTRGRPSTKQNPEITDRKGDKLIIHVPSGLGNDTEYNVNIAGSEATGETLKQTISKALEKFNGKMPDCLTEHEKTLLQEIIDVK